MKRLAAVGVLLAVEVFVGLESGIASVAELPGFFVGYGVAGLRTFAALRMGM